MDLSKLPIIMEDVNSKSNITPSSNMQFINITAPTLFYICEDCKHPKCEFPDSEADSIRLTYCNVYDSRSNDLDNPKLIEENQLYDNNFEKWITLKEKEKQYYSLLAKKLNEYFRPHKNPISQINELIQRKKLILTISKTTNSNIFTVEYIGTYTDIKQNITFQFQESQSSKISLKDAEYKTAIKLLKFIDEKITEIISERSISSLNDKLAKINAATKLISEIK